MILTEGWPTFCHAETNAIARIDSVFERLAGKAISARIATERVLREQYRQADAFERRFGGIGGDVEHFLSANNALITSNWQSFFDLRAADMRSARQAMTAAARSWFYGLPQRTQHNRLALSNFDKILHVVDNFDAQIFAAQKRLNAQEFQDWDQLAQQTLRLHAQAVRDDSAVRLALYENEFRDRLQRSKEWLLANRATYWSEIDAIIDAGVQQTHDLIALTQSLTNKSICAQV